MSLTLVRPVALSPSVWPSSRAVSAEREAPRYNPRLAIHNQWPLRGLAFASDAGFIAYLAGGPRMRPWAHRAWLLSIPYYAYALSQPQNRRDVTRELVFQTTANGVLPYATVHGAERLATRMSLPVSRLWSRLSRVAWRQLLPFWRSSVATAALVVLTPSLNDRLVRRVFPTD